MNAWVHKGLEGFVGVSAIATRANISHQFLYLSERDRSKANAEGFTEGTPA